MSQLNFFVFRFGFSDLKEYVLICGVDALSRLRLQFTLEQMKGAFIQSNVLQDRYKVDFSAKVAGECKSKFE